MVAWSRSPTLPTWTRASTDRSNSASVGRLHDGSPLALSSRSFTTVASGATYTGVVFTGLESPSHIILLLIACVLFFGSKRLPEIGRSVGQGLRGFKDALSGAEPPETPAAEPISLSPDATHASDTTQS